MQKRSSSSVQIFYPRLDKEALTQKLGEMVEELEGKLPLCWVVLFGSYAHGNYTVASDVDLLVVYRGKARQEAFAIVKKTLDVPLLEPHVYSEDEYERLRRVIGQMTADGVVLYPPETNKR